MNYELFSNWYSHNRPTGFHMLDGFSAGNLRTDHKAIGGSGVRIARLALIWIFNCWRGRHFLRNWNIFFILWISCFGVSALRGSDRIWASDVFLQDRVWCVKSLGYWARKVFFGWNVWGCEARGLQGRF